MILALTLLALGANDPRPELIELQLEGRHEAALVEVERALANDPQAARQWGFEYLQGHLMEHLPNRQDDSSHAFNAAMTSVPMLANRSRYRLASQALTSGHPQVAAALLGTVMASDPSPSLIPKTVQLLTLAVQQGGYCQVLSESKTWSLKSPQRRQLQLAQVDCDLAASELESAVARLEELLRENQEDDTAIGAAGRLIRLTPKPALADVSVLLGLAYFHHRQFRLAATYLDRGLEAENATWSRRDIDRSDVLYARARCDFWLGEYTPAAHRFAAIANQESKAERVARALYQQARSLELEGDWDGATQAYRRAVGAHRTSNWAPAALLAALRIDWRQDREESALELFDQLRSRRSWHSMAERAALFLAVSDIVRGRPQRAEGWLQAAARGRRTPGLEIAYWQGRLAELQGRAPDAVNSYITVMLEDFYHPLASAAYTRLQQPVLARVAQADAERRASSQRSQDLYIAWLLLGDSRESGQQARARLRSRLVSSSRTRPFLEMQIAVPADWGLWHLRPTRPEDRLLTLGIAEEMSPAVRKALPLGDLSSALAASQLLSASDLPRPSLYVAEIVSKRLPDALPQQFLPPVYRRFLYPRPFHDLVEREATRFAVDPNLLTAIIREESRFDTDALSAASARGLTQFVLPTAERLVEKMGWREIEPLDLHRPEISISLGAAYLAELAEGFDGRPEVVITAYNAGEDQARLWLSYCFSREPEEYFSKVGFSQTRAYLRKVASSRAQYREIYDSAEITQ